MSRNRAKAGRLGMGRLKTLTLAAAVSSPLLAGPWLQAQDHPAGEAPPAHAEQSEPGMEPGPNPPPGPSDHDDAWPRRTAPRHSQPTAPPRPDGQQPTYGPRPGREPLSPEQQQALVQVIQDYHPLLAQRLAEVREPDLSRVLHQYPWLRRLVEMRESDPQAYRLRLADLRLDRESAELARNYQEALRQSDHSQAQALLDQLELVIEEHFQVRRELRQMEIERFERRIAEMRRELAEREQQAERLKQERLQLLTGAGQAAEF